MDYLSFFLKCFTTFFVIVDPPGNLPFFIALTERLPEDLRERISKKSTLIACSLLIVITISGGFILEVFHVTVDSLRIAGGILLFIISVDILHGGLRRETYRRRAEESIDIDSIAVFPLALPLYTGPGAITAGIVLYSQASDLIAKAIVISSAVIVYAFVRISHIYSNSIIRMLGKSGADIIAKILAIFLAAIAVEFVFTGLKGKLEAIGLRIS